MYNLQSKKTITGVYGGSFNPIHLGHTSMAAEILRLGLVDEMWLVVSPQNPLKDSGLWDDAFRLSLARTAVAGHEGIKVCDVEFGLPRPSYMITTLDTLAERFPDREFVLVIGQDNWDCFDRWYRWRDILCRYRLLVLPRQGENGAPTGTRHIAADGEKGVTFVNVPLIDLSSTWIRSQITGNPHYDGKGLAPEVWLSIRKNCPGGPDIH